MAPQGTQTCFRACFVHVSCSLNHEVPNQALRSHSFASKLSLDRILIHLEGPHKWFIPKSSDSLTSTFFFSRFVKTAELLCLLVTIRPHDEVFELRDLQHDISEGRHWRRRLRHLRVSTTVYTMRITRWVSKHTLITRNSCRSVGDELLATSVNDPEIQAEKCLKFCAGKLGLRIFFLDAIAIQAVQVWSSHQAGKDSEASHQHFQRKD